MKVLKKFTFSSMKVLSLLSLATVFVSANTASCHFIYEPKAPEKLKKFKKI